MVQIHPALPMKRLLLWKGESIKEYKIAVALDYNQYQALKRRKDGKWLHNPELRVCREHTHEGDYAIVSGEWIGLGDPEYESFLRAIEQRRHALVSVSDDGEIWLDVETKDEDGEDETFQYILGWNFNILKWGESSELIV